MMLSHHASQTEENDPRQPLRVALLTTARLVGDGIERTLNAEGSLKVVATLTTSMPWRALLEIERPHVVLVAVDAAGASRLVGELIGLSPASKVVACGLTDDEESEVLAWALAGVSGYAARDASAPDLVAVIRSVGRGEVRYATPAAHVVREALASLGQRDRNDGVWDTLTRREREVMTLLGSRSNKDIARLLGIELHTVKNHVHNIFTKLGVHRRDDAASLGARPSARDRTTSR